MTEDREWRQAIMEQLRVLTENQQQMARTQSDTAVVLEGLKAGLSGLVDWRKEVKDQQRDQQRDQQQATQNAPLLRATASQAFAQWGSTIVAIVALIVALLAPHIHFTP